MLAHHARRAGPGWLAVVVFVGVPLLAPRARAQGTVSLAALLEHADRNAPAIVIAEARLEEGASARSAADRWLSDPLRIEVGAGPRIADGAGTDFDAILALTQPIEVAGERGARIDAAERLIAQREAEVESVRWQVHRDVHYGFHQAIEARARANAARSWREFAERMLRIARRRGEAGDISDLDVAMAVTELASAMQESLRAEAAFREACLELAELTGWPASDPPTPLGDLDQPGAIPEDSSLVARAIAGHPLLAALDAAVAAREASVRVADVEAFPTLDFGLSFAREGSAGSPANYIGLAVFGVAIPVWDANAEARARARADLTVAEAERDALRGVIEARVLRAAGTLRAARDRVEIFVRDVLPGFQRNLTLLEQGFELGELGALEVASATRRLLEVQGNALDAFSEYHRALAELEAQVGSEVVADEAHATETAVEDGGAP